MCASPWRNMEHQHSKWQRCLDQTCGTWTPSEWILSVLCLLMRLYGTLPLIHRLRRACDLRLLTQALARTTGTSDSIWLLDITGIRHGNTCTCLLLWRGSTVQRRNHWWKKPSEKMVGAELFPGKFDDILFVFFVNSLWVVGFGQVVVWFTIMVHANTLYALGWEQEGLGGVWSISIWFWIGGGIAHPPTWWATWSKWTPIQWLLLQWPLGQLRWLSEG